MELPIRIASWRKARRLSQAEFAAAVGVTVSAVSLWESGKASPSLKRLKVIVDRLGLTMARFYGRVPRARAAA
jgi:transcriptional regulator with XRE-family HTH domain